MWSENDVPRLNTISEVNANKGVLDILFFFFLQIIPQFIKTYYFI